MKVAKQEGSERARGQKDERQRPPVSRSTLKKALSGAARIPGDVVLFFFGSTRQASASLDALRICRELILANPRIMLRVHDEAERERCSEHGVQLFPTMILAGKNKGGMRFHGVPGGYLILALVEGLRVASAGEPGLRPKTMASLEAIKRPLKISVYTTPVSPVCARAASLAFRLAAGSERIRAEVFNALDFPELARSHGVENGPRTFVNERVEISGAPDEAEYVERVLGALVPSGNGYA